jgi:hypothetical protein
MPMEPGKYLSSLSLLALACGGHAVDLGHADAQGAGVLHARGLSKPARHALPWPCAGVPSKYSAAPMVVAGSLVCLMVDHSVTSDHHIASCRTGGCDEFALAAADAQSTRR